jgi:aldehyde:ferredoxin oxidoreductase
MSYLYGGTIVRVNLSTGKIEKQPTAAYADKWLGGRGFNTRILYKELQPHVDALSPDNILIFSVGPLTGSMFPGSGRVEVAAKSPVTGIQGMSNMGGYWGPELKYAGYDSIVIKGKASKPVYISINNDNIEVKDASHIWGMDTYITQDAIQAELGDPEIEVVCIGPGGENGVAYGSVQTRMGNAAGRTGMGTVMGSKNLKAIAARGTKGVSVADPDRFLEICLKAMEEQKPLINNARTVDMAENTPPSTWAVVLGNYESNVWDKQKDLVGGHKPFWESHKNRQGEGRTGCFNCQVRCMDYFEEKDLGPLVASCNIYGSATWVIKNADIQTWYAVAAKCHRLGIDVLSATRMIAWASELYEKGIISLADTGGIPLEWGNRESLIKVLDLIARNEGFGAVLAAKAEEAAAKLGPDVEPVLNLKGAPLGETNLMNFRARALGAAVNPRGTDEYRARAGSFDNLGTGAGSRLTAMASPDSWEARAAMTIVDKAVAQKREKEGASAQISQFDCESRGELAALANRIISVTDSVGQCKWNTVFLNVGIGIDLQAAALSAGMGREIKADDLIDTASRIAAQERAFAVREGLTREQDTLPKKLINYRMQGTWPEDKVDPEDLERMKNEYYAAMAWDMESGVPSRETLDALSLSDVASDLEKMGKLPNLERSEPNGELKI